jgi:hypothetical protein
VHGQTSAIVPNFCAAKNSITALGVFLTDFLTSTNFAKQTAHENVVAKVGSQCCVDTLARAEALFGAGR